MPEVSVSRVIAAPQQDVWAVLSDIANARRWNPSWSRIEMSSGQTHGTGTTFRAQTQEDRTYDFEVSEWVAGELITFSPVRDPSEPRYSITLEYHSFRLEPLAEDETNVVLTARASARGLRGRLVALLLWPGYQKHGLNAALDSLQALFEPESAGAPDAEPGELPDQGP